MRPKQTTFLPSKIKNGAVRQFVQSHFYVFRLRPYDLGVPELFVVLVGFTVGFAVGVAVAVLVVCLLLQWLLLRLLQLLAVLPNGRARS